MQNLFWFNFFLEVIIEVIIKPYMEFVYSLLFYSIEVKNIFNSCMKKKTCFYLYTKNKILVSILDTNEKIAIKNYVILQSFLPNTKHPT